MVNLPDVHKSLNSPNMVEEFMCGGSAAVIPTNSSGKMSKQIDPVIGNIPYAAQANDYKYYCDNMGICPSPKISIEGFTDNYGSESYLEPPGYNTPNQQEIQALQHDLQYQDGLPQNVQQPQSQPSNCQMSEQSTTYQYPISELSKKQYDAAMKVYLNNGQCSTPQKQSPYSMNNVNGLYDEEIGQYMRVQDTNIPYTVQPSLTYANTNLMAQQVPRNNNNFTPMPSDDYHSLSSISEQVPIPNNFQSNIQSNTPRPRPVPTQTPKNYMGNNTPRPAPISVPRPAPTQTPKNYMSNNTPSPQVSPQSTSNIDLANLNQYLANINQYLANINQYLPGSNIYNSPNMPNINMAPQAPQTSQTTSNTPPNKWNYIMDTVLFIAAGILIIILCDLLFKIAYSIGMRDTFRMMKPYLTEIDELKAKIAELVPDDD
jgi:hypothetical protein